MSDHFFDFSGYARGADETRLRKAHLTSIRAQLKLQKRVVLLEDELAWVSALASSLAGVCIEKGFVTSDELKERIARLDAAHDASGATPSVSAPSKPGARRRPP